MPINLDEYLVIGVSSRALFDLSLEDGIFRTQGLQSYEDYQIQNENKILNPGAGFPLIRAMLNLNNLVPGKRKAEVIIMSRNSAETSLRIFNSIDHYRLDITRAALSGGAPLAPYLHAFSVDLFLSLDETDVQTAIKSGVASAIVYAKPEDTLEEIEQIRIAFDGDAVVFSDESERIFQDKGLEAFLQHEKENARKPLPEGPFAKLLKTLAFIQAEFNGDRKSPIRTALVTSRNSPSHERVIRTLRTWKVDINEAFFLGGVPKAEVLKAFKPHMFFDDQHMHCAPASRVVPTGRVPYGTQIEIPDARNVHQRGLGRAPASKELVQKRKKAKRSAKGDPS
jgi:5'-nucleotidase